MVKTEVDTFWARIFVGFKHRETGKVHSIDTARKLCSDYVNAKGLCITLTPTEYIYSNDYGDDYAGETGCIVGLINYPRFPSQPEEIREIALELAQILKSTLDQSRVSVMFPDKTVMFGAG